MGKTLLTPDDLDLLENRFDGPIPFGAIETPPVTESSEGRLAEIARIIASRTERIIEATNRIAKAEQDIAAIRREPYDPSDVRASLIRAGINSDKRCIRAWNDDITRLEEEAQALYEADWDAMQGEDPAFDATTDATPVAENDPEPPCSLPCL